ncbi:hypothetical protein MASR1M107_12260 [Ignavibacteriales bacterium]
MNLADVTLLISQGTFAVIFVFAVGSFVAYKVKGKSTPVYVDRKNARVRQIEQPVIVEEYSQNSSHFHSHAFAEPTVTTPVIVHSNTPKITSKTVRISSSRNQPESRYKVVNYTFEGQPQRATQKPDINTNWS